MNKNLTFCETCRKDVAFNIDYSEMKNTIKGEQFSFCGEKAVCAECNNDVYVADLEDRNLKALYDTFRQKKIL